MFIFCTQPPPSVLVGIGILDCQEKLDMDVRLADGIDSNFDGADNT